MTGPAVSGERYPLSFQQEGGPEDLAPNNTVVTVLRVRGEVRIDALEGALADLVDRHEALRTRLIYGEPDGPAGYQEVVLPRPVVFTVRDDPLPPGLARDERAIELYRLVSDEDILFSETPSLRAALHRFDGRDAVLTLLSHHLFGDNWSSSLLRRDLAAFYTARVSGTPHALPAATPYREYAVWQRNFSQGEQAAATVRYWTGKLSGAGLQTLPTDRPNGPDALTASSAVRNFTIDLSFLAKITESAARYRCTPYHLFLAAAAVFHERVRGSADVTLLTVNNGRDVKGFHNTVGFISNPVPIRLNLDDGHTYRDIMRLARKATLEAQRNLIPLQLILEANPDVLKPYGDPWSVPFVFNYARPRATASEIQFADGVTPVAMPPGMPSRNHRGVCPWGFTLLPTGEVCGIVEYEPGLIDAATIDRWIGEFVDLVRVIAEVPEQAWRT
jgi:hypothetical protein